MPHMLCTLRPLLGIATALMVGACGSGAAGTTAPGPPPAPPPPPPPAPTWSLAWSDEFDGTAGAAVDGTKWAAETGGSGWGNQESEYYTAGTENAALDGSGHLVITARAETNSL